MTVLIECFSLSVKYLIHNTHLLSLYLIVPEIKSVSNMAPKKDSLILASLPSSLVNKLLIGIEKLRLFKASWAVSPDLLSNLKVLNSPPTPFFAVVL